MFRLLAVVRPVFLTVLVGAAICVTLPATAGAQSVMTEVSPERMTKILTSMGLEVAEASGGKPGEQPPLMVELGGYRVLVFLLNGNTDAQLYTVFPGQKADTDLINRWNRDFRFARAYRDDDGDPALEADLDFVGGVTEEAIRAWVRLFRDNMVDYAAHVN